MTTTMPATVAPMSDEDLERGKQLLLAIYQYEDSPNAEGLVPTDAAIEAADNALDNWMRCNIHYLFARLDDEIKARAAAERDLAEAKRDLRAETVGHDNLRDAMAKVVRERGTLRREFERECSDGDKVCAALGLTAEQSRTEGGSLNVPRIVAHIGETIAALQEASNRAVAFTDKYVAATHRINEIERDRDTLRRENDTFRGLLGSSAKDCQYCGLPAADQAKCVSGFPGCSRADDQILFQHFAAAYECDTLRQENDSLRGALSEIREIWAGAECGEPVHAQEAYAIRLCKQQYQIACSALSAPAAKEGS